VSAGTVSVSDASNLLFEDMAKAAGVDTALIVDLMKRHPERFIPMIKSALDADDKRAEKPSAPAKAKLRPGHRPGFDHEPDGTLLERGEPSPERKRHPEKFAPMVKWELSERQRRLVRDLQNIAPANGGRKLSEAEAVARVLAGERQQALALTERPANDRKLEDEAVRRLVRQSGFKTEAEARAAVKRMQSRFRS
jgi:hypothetical protein